MPWRFETGRSGKLRDNCLCCFVVIIHLDFVFEAEKRQEFVCFLELNIVRLWRRVVYVRKKVFLKITGAPNDCFLKNICSKKQILTTIEYSMVWGRQKISKWPFHSCTIFEAYLMNSLRFSEVLFFTFQAPKFELYFEEKGSLKFSDSNIWWRGNNKNANLRKDLNCS